MLLALLVAAALAAPSPPAHVAVRRLNRTEYDQTVADLLGTALRPAADFPPEDSTFGFDNVAGALTISPLQARLYDAAAAALVDDAFARGRLPGCDVRAPGCVQRGVAAFAAQAWRRPLAAREATALARVARRAAAAGATADEAARAACHAVLVSPHFLFRIEPAAGAGPLGAWTLASRLSYFAWSTMPDGPLRAAAARGTLTRPAELRAQAMRLLDDDRSARFVDSFAGQWLPLRQLDGHYVDKGTFPAYDPALAASMKRETALTFAAFLREPRPLTELLTARFTFLDDRLARHYGLAAVGPGFHRVELAAGARAGVLGHASVLTATSHAERTGIVKRGQWVLSQLLCSDPPPPPPGVPPLPSVRESAGSQRDRLEDHRTEVRCSACHKVMDAIGFGLENFDAIGRWRARDGKFPIDASGRLPGGVTFDGPAALAAALSRDPRLPRCLAQRLFTYALGRPPGEDDGATLDAMVAARDGAAPSVRDMVLALVASASFRGEGDR